MIIKHFFRKLLFINILLFTSNTYGLYRSRKTNQKSPNGQINLTVKKSKKSQIDQLTSKNLNKKKITRKKNRKIRRSSSIKNLLSKQIPLRKKRNLETFAKQESFLFFKDSIFDIDNIFTGAEKIGCKITNIDNEEFKIAYRIKKYPDLRKEFNQELQFFTTIEEHPNIVKLKRADNDRCILYLEAADYDLFEFKKINKKRKAFKQNVLKIVKQLAEGLLHIHKSGYIHRDIKPSNIIVFDNEELRVAFIDFTRTEKFNPKTNAAITYSQLTTSSYFSVNCISEMCKNIYKKRICDICTLPISKKSKRWLSPKLSKQYCDYCVKENRDQMDDLLFFYNITPYEYSIKDDIYSLGMVIYELVYPYENILDQILKFQYENSIPQNTSLFSLKKLVDLNWKPTLYESNNKFYQFFNDLILRCIDKDSENRPYLEEIIKNINRFYQETEI